MENSTNVDSEVSSIASRRTRDPMTKTGTRMKPVILVVMLERMTYYGVIANLLIFFKYEVYKDSDSASVNASKSVLVLSGVSWMMCVAGGWISDAKLGKLKTLILGLVFYVVGLAILVSSAFLIKYKEVDQSVYRAVLVFGAIVISLVGEGAYKANISPFGAEQLSKQDEGSTRRFFNYYYCSVNVGALFGFGLVAFVQLRFGFHIGFAIPFGSIFLALIIFVSQKKHYKSAPLQRILGKVFQILYEARKIRRKIKRNTSLLIQPEESWLDYAKLKHGGSFLDWEVEEIKLFVRVIPVFLVLIPYWAIYSQMQATFLEQGIRMNLHSSKTFSVPASWLNLINIVVIVTLIPIMEKVVYPYLTRRGYNNSPISRITFGILIACLSIVAAGLVEIFVIQDLKDETKNITQCVDGIATRASKLSVFWQMPQYMLVGMSEVFAVVAGLEFAYRNAPKSMQSIVMALYFVTHSLGSLLGFALLELSEICNIIRDKYHGYADHTYYYYLLCVLMLIAWFVFIVYINHSEYRESKKHLRYKVLGTRLFGRSPVNMSEDRLVSSSND